MKLSDLRRAALNLLARREHSSLELQRKLLAKEGVTFAQVEELIKGLIHERLLSDARFAEVYIQSRLNRGHGPLRIREGLKEKGISNSIIEQYLDGTADLWQEKLYHTWQKRFGGKKPKDFAEYAKQARFLQYRGFDSRQIKAFLDKLNSHPYQDR